MQSFPPTIILRHRKENLKKCSLRGLEKRPDFDFYPYPIVKLPDLKGYILLSVEAPPLTVEDANKGLLILDGTWRYAAKMMQCVDSTILLEKRSLPIGYKTAYPRCQECCPDPGRGLASIEAIYLAYSILGRDTSGLLDLYYWKQLFLQINSN